MAEEEIEEVVEEKKGGNMKMIIMSALFILIGIGAGGGAVFFMVNKPVAEAAPVEDEETVAEAGEEGVEAMPSTPYYFSLDPAFVVNFAGAGRAKFLQVNIDGLTRNPGTKEDITTHLPHIRNNIVMLLSSKKYSDINTPEGKETLRQEVLKEMNTILETETGSGDIEDVYFTSFVMQ